MLLGQRVHIFTGHKNLSFERFASDRVRRWRLYVEEFGPRIQWLPGKHNVVADSLSRLEGYQQEIDQATLDREIDHEVYAVDPVEMCPMAYTLIRERQEIELKNVMKNQLHELPWGDAMLWTTEKNKIAIPTSLRKPIMDWYHRVFIHPGAARMLAVINQHFAWPRMKQEVIEFVQTCDQCQKWKKQHKNYSEMPIGEPELVPWRTVCVDMVGPYT